MLNTNSFWLGLQKHSGDARAYSFLKILELIPHTSKPPQILFVENVVGFEVCVSICFLAGTIITFSTIICTCYQSSSFNLFVVFIGADFGYPYGND